jgi:hypothetical protein
MGDLQPQAQDCTTPAQRKASAEAECKAIRSQCQQAVLDFRDATSRLAEFVATGRWRDMGHQTVAAFLAAEFPHLAAMDIPAQQRKALSAALDKDGATQRAIAGQLGVSQQTVSRDLGFTNIGKSGGRGRPRKDDPGQVKSDKDLGKALRDYRRGTPETRASVDVVLEAVEQVAPPVQATDQAPVSPPEPSQAALPAPGAPEGTPGAPEPAQAPPEPLVETVQSTLVGSDPVSSDCQRCADLEHQIEVHRGRRETLNEVLEETRAELAEVKAERDLLEERLARTQAELGTLQDGGIAAERDALAAQIAFEREAHEAYSDYLRTMYGTLLDPGMVREFRYADAKAALEARAQEAPQAPMPQT